MAVLSARFTVDARRHGELLAPMIRAVLADAGARPTDLGAVVVGMGPGPFTSLRIGMVTAAAFADALRLGVHGVCSLDGIGAVTSGPTVVVTDARRREVFWARYAQGVRVGDPGVARPADVAAAARDAGVDQIIGPGAVLYPEVFAGFDRHAGPAAGSAGAAVGSPPGYPSPAVLARLAAADLLAGRPADPPVPLYLRRPDAADPHPPKPVAV